MRRRASEIPLARVWYKKKPLWMGMIVIILVGVYAIYSVASWNTYHAHTTRTIDIMKTDLDNVLSGFTDIKEGTLASLEKKLQELDTRTDTMCRTNKAVAYQVLVFGELKQVVKGCDESRLKLQKTADSLRALIRYTHAWNTMQQKVVTFTTGEVKAADIGAQEGRWTVLQKDIIIKFQDDSAINQLKQTYSTAVQAVAVAWKEVSGKHTAKDYDGYNKAVENLNNTYLKLADASDNARKENEALIQKAKNSFQTLD